MCVGYARSDEGLPDNLQNFMEPKAWKILAEYYQSLKQTT